MLDLEIGEEKMIISLCPNFVFASIPVSWLEALET